jgi:hypothetical protein
MDGCTREGGLAGWSIAFWRGCCEVEGKNQPADLMIGERGFCLLWGFSDVSAGRRFPIAQETFHAGREREQNVLQGPFALPIGGLKRLVSSWD